MNQLFSWQTTKRASARQTRSSIFNAPRLTIEALESRAMLAAHGDFNGDGYDDLAIGSPYADVNGIVNAGSVNVIYGRAGGLNATGDQQWHQDRSGISSTAKAGELFGFALATGDFNRDGFDDLAIGVPYEDASGKTDSGGVHVLYGSSAGLRASGSQFWTEVAADAKNGDLFGYSLAAGDFNGDSKGDLAIGVPRKDIGSATNAGGVNVLYGSISSGLRASMQQFWTQNSSGINDTAEKEDRFGQVLVAGDFNADGFSDLAIGVPNESLDVYLFPVPATNDVGAVAVIYGTANRLTGSGDQLLSFNADSHNDYFGSGLAAGDFNADGADDLAVYAPPISQVLRSGFVVTYAGGEEKLAMQGPVISLPIVDSRFSELGAGSGIKFGAALSSGDFNGDGFDELAIGAPNLGSGTVYIIHGGEFFLNLASVQRWEQGYAGLPGTGATGDQFGRSFAVGDYNNDGYYDLTVGVPFKEVSTKTNAGVVYVIYGSLSGLSAAETQIWSLDSPFINGDPGVNDQFGFSLAGDPIVGNQPGLSMVI